MKYYRKLKSHMAQARYDLQQILNTCGCVFIIIIAIGLDILIIIEMRWRGNSEIPLFFDFYQIFIGPFFTLIN